MESVGVTESFADYVDRLQVDPDEFTHLFNMVLINVTSFFRDPLIWDFLATRWSPRIIESARAGRDPIRVWIPGCASGEEAYTLAMLLAERLGVEELPAAREDLRDRRGRRGARQARAAIYSSKAGGRGPAVALLNRYFDRVGDAASSSTKELRPASDLRPARPGPGRADLAASTC